jgi:hypothetical protein
VLYSILLLEANPRPVACRIDRNLRIEMDFIEPAPQVPATVQFENDGPEEEASFKRITPAASTCDGPSEATVKIVAIVGPYTVHA